MQPVASNAVPPNLATTVQHAPKAQPPIQPEAEKTAGISARPASADEVTEATQRVEKFVQAMSSDLQFTVDDSSGAFVIRIVDRATQEVIRQMPSEEMLAIAKALDRLQGLLVRQQA